MACEIVLTQNRVALIDDADFESVSRFKWHARQIGNTWYAYGWISRHRKTALHRFLLDAKSGQQIDHKDGDGLNNQRTNLRFATYSQNGQNKRAKHNASTGFKGVRWDPGHRLYRAYLIHNGKRIDLPGYLDAEMAARAYDVKARELYGEFARPNFPDVDESAAILTALPPRPKRPGPNIKLTRELAEEIRMRRQHSGAPYHEIAAEYGVCTATISHICNGRQWKEAA